MTCGDCADRRTGSGGCGMVRPRRDHEGASREERLRRGTRSRLRAPLLTTGLLAALLSLAAVPTFAALTRVKPTAHAGTVGVRLGKKTNTYHKATAARPVLLTVQGPTRLRILARSLPPDAGRRTQRVRIELDGKPARGLALKRTASGKAALRGGAAVGLLRTRTLEIPAGPHQVRILPEGPESAVALRVFRGTKTKSAERWVNFAPQTFSRSLRARDGDRESTWYRFAPGSPLGLTVHGPLHLRVTTRLDFDQNAGSTQHYVVRVFLDDKPLESYSLKSQASHVVTYPEMPEVTPGMGRDLAFEVPAGTHRVRLELEGTTAPGAAARVQVLQKDLLRQTKAASRGRARS